MRADLLRIFRSTRREWPILRRGGRRAGRLGGFHERGYILGDIVWGDRAVLYTEVIYNSSAWESGAALCLGVDLSTRVADKLPNILCEVSSILDWSLGRCSTIASVLAFSETVIGKSLCEKLVVTEVAALWDLWQSCGRGSEGLPAGSTRPGPPTASSSPDQTKHQSTGAISDLSGRTCAGASSPLGPDDDLIEAAILRLSQLERARITVELVSSGGTGKKLAKMSSLSSSSAHAALAEGTGGMAFESMGRMAAAAGAVVKVWKTRLKASK